MSPVEDPFEAFKKKKVEQKAQDAAPVVKVEIPAEALEGRPKGFASHRYDFGRQETAGAPAAKPKGFQTTNVADGPKEGVAPGPKPRGFNLARIVRKPKA